MNELQSKYFNALRDHHLTLARSLNDPSIRGVREVISDLYRDDAHFVYELLQNADDQGATYSKFILTDSELLFIHNAPRHFTITDHTTHEADKERGELGDVNSILAIASSSKNNRQNEVPIGKFGLGFKSVFLFTDEPEIYDENFRFSISDYIVPNLISNDHPLRKPGETLFRFRFKRGEEKEAYRKINHKLRGLVNPILFLNNLMSIEWETADDAGYYRLEEAGNVGSGKKLKYEVVSDESERTRELWKFDRWIDDSKHLFISVVYVVEDGKLTTALHPLYCYLPTVNHSDLPVILHAPFRLTGNRESIMADDEHNQDMIARLSLLLAESLKEICLLGESNQTPWINDNILSFLPKHEIYEEHLTAAKLDIDPLAKGVLEALSSSAMLWCEQLGRYLPISEAFVADNNYLPDIYPSELLGELYGGIKGWVLPSLIPEIRKSAVLLKMIGVERLTPEKILRKVSADFLEKRTTEWLKAWYKSLLKVPNLWERGGDTFLRYQPIVKTIQEGVFVAPYTRGKETANVSFYTPGAEDMEGDNLGLIPFELTQDEEVKEFFNRLGIRGVDSFTMAEKIYLYKVNSEGLAFPERLRNLIWLIGICEYNLTLEQQKKIKNNCQLPGYCSGGWRFCGNDRVKVHNEDNDFFYKDHSDVPFFEKDKLSDVSPAEAEQIEEFVKSFAQVHSPTVHYEKRQIFPSEELRIPKNAQRPGYAHRGKKDWEYIKEPHILGMEKFLRRSAASDPKKASELICRLFINNHGSAIYYSTYRGEKKPYEIEPLYKSQLREASWIDEASIHLRKLLGLPVKEMQQESIESIKTALSESGIISQTDVTDLLEFIKKKGVLEDFQLEQNIKDQKNILAATNKCSLKWFKEVLELRLRYVEAGKKDDVELLITRLQSALDTLDMDDETDLREILPDGINVVLGPPGTGKTTEITRLIASMLDEDSSCRILVLTPTNAAAKVVADRLNKIGIEAYRGVNPDNEDLCAELEELDIPIYDKREDELPSILVSTVHYYAQTYSTQEECYLHDVEWDAVFIDEASMVTLDYVLFALLKSDQVNPDCKYYIVGDPQQLPPITNLDPLILDEAQLDEFNFYSFIGLTEFSKKPTKALKEFGIDLNVRLLNTQYRSVPRLCELMSNFAYMGKVNSDFKGEQLNLPSRVPLIFRRNFSVVRFPVTKEEGLITDLEKFKGSNYNIYSALFVKEVLQKFFYDLIEEGYNKNLSVGIITAYTAQKKLIEKLLNTNPISRSVNVDVFVNTVHQFQGDEFDIVILLLNPPNIKMEPKEKILLNKKYLINVATSRAKNTLIILYPDQSCNEKNFLHVNKHGGENNIERLAEKVFGRKINELTVHSKDIEEELFGSRDYLSGICEVMEHEEVNLHESESDSTYRFVNGGTTIDILYSGKGLRSGTVNSDC